MPLAYITDFIHNTQKKRKSCVYSYSPRKVNGKLKTKTKIVRLRYIEYNLIGRSISIFQYIVTHAYQSCRKGFLVFLKKNLKNPYFRLTQPMFFSALSPILVSKMTYVCVLFKFTNVCIHIRTGENLGFKKKILGIFRF